MHDIYICCNINHFLSLPSDPLLCLPSVSIYNFTIPPAWWDHNLTVIFLLFAALCISKAIFFFFSSTDSSPPPQNKPTFLFFFRLNFFLSHLCLTIPKSASSWVWNHWWQCQLYLLVLLIELWNWTPNFFSLKDNLREIYLCQNALFFQSGQDFSEPGKRLYTIINFSTI